MTSYRESPSERAHLAALVEQAVLAAARRIDHGDGFTVRELMAELDPAVRWVLDENLHRAQNIDGGRARVRYHVGGGR
jgi:hypothetical protein